MLKEDVLCDKISNLSGIRFILFCLLAGHVNRGYASSSGSNYYTLSNLHIRSNSSCINGRISSETGLCLCRPCWEGSTCNKYVDYYSPRFLVHKATAVVPSNVSGAVYRAWSSDDDLGLTCPLGPGESTRCPCASVKYQLFSPPGDHHFVLHSDTGILERASPAPSTLDEGNTYNYKLMVQSTPMEGYTEDLLYDILDLQIYVGSPFVRKIPWT